MYIISMVDTAVNLPPPILIPSFDNFVMFAKIGKHQQFQIWIHDYM